MFWIVVMGSVRTMNGIVLKTEWLLELSLKSPNHQARTG
jgi:hypothetical protein